MPKSIEEKLSADPPPAYQPPVQAGMTLMRVVERMIELYEPSRNPGASENRAQVLMRTPEGDMPVVGISGEPGMVILHFEIPDELPEDD